MTNKTQKIRCLACGELVLQDYDEKDPEASFAVVPLNYSSTPACVCADCIELYNSIDLEPEVWEKLFEANSADESNVIKAKSANTVTVQTEEQKYIPITEDKEFLAELRAKYRALDYSLDSLAALVKRTVFGQDEAVRKVVYSIYLNQTLNMLEDLDITFEATNSGGSPGFKRRHILLIGDTGVGKTLLATTAPKIFGVPYSISNATPITASGYVGEDVEQIIERLYAAAGNNLDAAESGIIILDEIDKKRHEPSASGKDVNGKSVQQELLKLLEPSTIWINKHSIPFRTANLTIIMMGPFVGIDEIVKRRTKKSTIGFSVSKDSEDDSDEILPEDLIEYGFIPEFVGRIPSICKLNKITIDVATNIIYSLLEKYDIIFKARGFELIFNPYLVSKIAEKVVNSSMGGRCVETELDTVIQPALWKVFQSLNGGICEFSEDGSAQIMRAVKNKKNDVEIVATPPIKGYEISIEID